MYDTIFALATAAGRAGVSIIRISGPAALDAASNLGAKVGRHDRRVVNLLAADGSLIDRVFALTFAKGHSFTGDQVVELHTHGSPAVVKAVLNRLDDLGLRQAEAGEFTRRALDSGRLDLAQVEGLADLIDAETEAQRRQAVRVFDGALGTLVDGWRKDLLRAAALLEATIDFVDEEVPVDVYPEVKALVEGVTVAVRGEADGVRVREKVRDGFEVALIGSPNSGKSTLLNRLAGRDAAITSDIAGTTRDVIEVRMDLDGFSVTFLDTAGLRTSSDVLEEIGIERGLQRAEKADIRVQLLLPGEDKIDLKGDGKDFLLSAKCDIHVNKGHLGISGKTGEGIDALVREIVNHLQDQVSSAGLAIRQRHEVALRQSETALSDVLIGLGREDHPVDLVAEDLRTAIRRLDSLIGRIDVENVLGEIFSSFCIGK